MAACSCPEHIFEKHLKDIDNSSFPEIFGELHLKDNYESSSFSTPFPQSSRTSFSSCSSTLTTNDIFPIDIPGSEISTVHHENNSGSTNYQDFHKGSVSSMNSDNLSACTEDFGIEGAVNDICNDGNWEHQEQRKCFRRYIPRESCYSKIGSRGGFPPPISCIGMSGKPWVYFKSYKGNGRFILKEIRVHTQEFMQASRENGRLRLTFVHSESDDEYYDDDDEEDDESI